jgi:hypothetical protein
MRRQAVVRRPPARRRPQGPQRGTNISAPQIAAEGRNLAAENVGFINQNLPATANNFSNIQQGQIDAQAARLDNQYTQDARNIVGASLSDAQSVSGLGQSLANQSAIGFQTSGPTEIEQELYRQGQADLALGRSLSPEQMRDASQSARQAFAARGLGTGMAAASAELLNRDRFASQRQAERRQFAASANQMREENVMNRRDAAGRLGALGGGLLGDSARVFQAGATTLANLDPYSRAMSAGINMGQFSGQAAGNMLGGQLGGMIDLSGNAATFNTNRQDSLYNNYQNNQAAIRSANIQAGASNNSATMGMIGTGVGAAVGIGAIAI